MQIQGIDGMTLRELEQEVHDGGKFVIFQWTISVIFLTFKRPTNIHYIPPGGGTLGKALVPTLASCVVGWWGFPWGVIYTIESIFVNLKGGRDVTDGVLDSLRHDLSRG